MNHPSPDDLQQFRDFVNEQLMNGGKHMSPEECLDLWRLHHPSAEELAESVAAIREALEQSARGEGRSARDVLAELRAELNLPAVREHE
jgi:hypothetical protein